MEVLCPALGKQKIAQVLCRAGLHLGTTTVARILKEPPQPNPAETRVSSQFAKAVKTAEELSAEAVKRVVIAKRVHHVWHVDLTLVPTQLGFWASWLPFCFAAVLALRPPVSLVLSGRISLRAVTTTWQWPTTLSTRIQNLPRLHCTTTVILYLSSSSDRAASRRFLQDGLHRRWSFGSSPEGDYEQIGIMRHRRGQFF
jgi:hypothetical protein